MEAPRKIYADGQELDNNDYKRIEEASIFITSTLTATLCLMFIYSLGSRISTYIDEYYAPEIKEINDKYEKLKVSDKTIPLNTLEEAREKAIIDLERDKIPKPIAWGLTFLLGGMMSFGLIAIVVNISKVIYKGCDPSYPIR